MITTMSNRKETEKYRTITKFLWLPKRIGWRFKWLKKVSWTQQKWTADMRLTVDGKRFASEPVYYWVDLYWMD